MTGNIFINKVEASGIIAFDLIDYKPDIETVEFDIKDYLYMEMIAKKKNSETRCLRLILLTSKGRL